MRKICFLTVGLILSVISAAACGKASASYGGSEGGSVASVSDGVTASDDAPADSESTPTASQTASENESGAEADENRPDGTGKDSGENRPGEAEEHDPETPAAPINNNGHFVQYGDTVYFHVPDEEAMEESSLFGEFADSDHGPTILMAYDVGTGHTKAVQNDHAWGCLTVSGNFLCFPGRAFPDSPEETIVKCGLNGETYEGKDSGNCVCFGGDRGGHYLVGWFYAEGNDTSGVWEVHLVPHKDAVPMESVVLGSGAECVAVIGDQLIYMIWQKDPERPDQYDRYLMQIGMNDGTKIALGRLPKPEYGGCEVDQIELRDSDLYFSYGRYEGTGRFYSGGWLMGARLGAPDSLLCQEEFMGGKGLSSSPAFRMTEGKPAWCAGIPLSAGVKEDALGYYDERGEWVEAAPQGYARRVGKENDGPLTDIEVAELVDGAIYAVRNVCERVPEDDIGWRMAYRRQSMQAIRVDCETGAETVLYERVR
ncbi:hypothetical protein [Lachnoclostridium sp. Marseille-P6806]|uniref:hypothetical protein n=1 Tax=Lachnoclostridium sp. Marseille-P6806 TaxID=2364793 RepID=UPI00102F7D2D|nr:hypothetical protein [Lachnoclostridium sp. Marseille-P6806]